MSENSEIENLRRRVAELEKQLAEERESFEWDLKAAKEAADATIRKLEQQLADCKKTSAPAGGSDVELLQKRAMLAERRVAELQAEIQKLQVSRIEKPSTVENSFLRQRAEQAEKEREELRKEKRALERRIEELENKLRKQQEELDKNASLRAELEKLRGEVAAKEREIKKLENSLAQATSDAGEKNLSATQAQLDDKTLEVERLRKELAQAQEDNRKVLEEKKRLEAKVVQLENDLGQLKITSGQILEQRERESERLKADLKQAREQGAKTSQQLADLQKQLTELEKELEQKRYEYSRLLEQLEKMRESQDTQVGRPPVSQESKTDPFEERTVKTAVPLGSREGETVRDGKPLGAELPPPPVAEQEFLQSPQPPAQEQSKTDEVVTGQLVQEDEEKLETLEPLPEEKTLPEPQKPRFGTNKTDIVREKAAGKPFPLNLWLAASPLKRGLLLGSLVFLIVVVGAAVWWSKWSSKEQTADVQNVVAVQENQGEQKPVVAQPQTADAGTQPSASSTPAVNSSPSAPETSNEQVDQQEVQKNIAQIKELMLKKNFAELLRLTRYLAEKHPKSGLAHFYLGKALFYNKELQAASDELYLSLQLDPSLREAWYELVGVNLVLKRKDRACEAAAKYIEASPAQDGRAAALKKNLAKWGCK